MFILISIANVTETLILDHIVDVFGVAEFNCTNRFGKFFIEFSPLFLWSCSCVHIPAINTVHNNLITYYELTIHAC